MMPHDIQPEQLSALLDDELSPQETESVRAAVDASPQLQEELRQLQCVRDAVSALLAPAPQNNPLRAIRARIASQQSTNDGPTGASPAAGTGMESSLDSAFQQTSAGDVFTPANAEEKQWTRWIPWSVAGCLVLVIGGVLMQSQGLDQVSTGLIEPKENQRGDVAMDSMMADMEGIEVQQQTELPGLFPMGSDLAQTDDVDSPRGGRVQSQVSQASDFPAPGMQMPPQTLGATTLEDTVGRGANYSQGAAEMQIDNIQMKRQLNRTRAAIVTPNTNSTNANSTNAYGGLGMLRRSASPAEEFPAFGQSSLPQASTDSRELLERFNALVPSNSRADKRNDFDTNSDEVTFTDQANAKGNRGSAEKFSDASAAAKVGMGNAPAGKQKMQREAPPEAENRMAANQSDAAKSPTPGGPPGRESQRFQNGYTDDSYVMMSPMVRLYSTVEVSRFREQLSNSVYVQVDPQSPPKSVIGKSQPADDGLPNTYQYLGNVNVPDGKWNAALGMISSQVAECECEIVQNENLTDLASQNDNVIIELNGPIPQRRAVIRGLSVAAGRVGGQVRLNEDLKSGRSLLSFNRVSPAPAQQVMQLQEIESVEYDADEAAEPGAGKK